MKRKLQGLRGWEIKKILRTRTFLKRSGVKLFFRFKKQGNPSFTIVVPLSFNKSAVKRHKTERQIRNMVNSVYNELLPVNFVIMVGKATPRITAKEIKGVVEKLLSKML